MQVTKQPLYYFTAQIFKLQSGSTTVTLIKTIVYDWGQTKHCRDKKVQQSAFMVQNALTKIEYRYSFSQTSLDDPSIPHLTEAILNI